MKKLLVNKTTYAFLYRLLFIFFCAWGLILNFAKWETPTLTTLSYYTIQSNLFCLILFIDLVVRMVRKQTLSPRYHSVKGGFTVMIFITFFIYHFILRPGIMTSGVDYEVYQWSDILVHYIAPLMVLIDHFLFDEALPYHPYDPLKWLMIPLGYWLYTLLYASLGGRYIIGDYVSKYPYFFLNFEEFGVLWVLISVVLLSLFYVAMGYGLMQLDKLILKYHRKNQSQSVEK